MLTSRQRLSRCRFYSGIAIGYTGDNKTLLSERNSLDRAIDFRQIGISDKLTKQGALRWSSE